MDYKNVMWTFCCWIIAYSAQYVRAQPYSQVHTSLDNSKDMWLLHVCVCMCCLNVNARARERNQAVSVVLMWLNVCSLGCVVLALPLSSSSVSWCERDVATSSWIQHSSLSLPACTNMHSTGIRSSFSPSMYLLLQVTCFHTECHPLFLSLCKHAQMFWGILCCSAVCCHSIACGVTITESECDSIFLLLVKWNDFWVYAFFSPEGNLLLLVIQ